MSGGTWNYKQEAVTQFLIERINDPNDSTFYTDFTRLAQVLIELGRALDEITHDLDWHYACDSQIDHLGNFEREALEKLREAVNAWLK